MNLIVSGNAFQCRPGKLDDLPTDSLVIIFQLVMETQFESAVTLQLVCRKWHCHLTNNMNLWAAVFRAYGFPFPNSGNFQSSPLNAQHAKSAFVRATSPWLLNRARSCLTPVGQVVETDLEFIDYKAVKFYEGTHVIAYNKSEIRVCDISQPTQSPSIQTGSKIVSLCVFDRTVYYALKTQSIWSFPLSSPQKRVEFASCDDEELMLIFACDRWLVSVSDQSLKLWDRETKKCKGGIPVDPSMQNFQMDWNHLYWTENSDWNWNLVCWDLNTDQIQKYELVSGVNHLHTIHVSSKRCSLIVQSEFQKYNIETDFSEDTDIGTKFTVINLDLNTNKRITYDTPNIGLNDNPVLRLSNGLTLFGRDVQDTDYILGGLIVPRPQIIELRDLEGKIVHSLQNDFIHGSSAIWSIAIIQGKLCYATQNKIVEIIFPENSSKRSAENKLEGDLKRQKLS